MAEGGEIILYRTEDGGTRIQVTLQDETVWLTQAQMTELFQRDQSVISRHINNIFKEGELEEGSNMHFLHIANSDKPVAHYNLDVIISVGYRVKSHRGTQFRIWATGRLREYIVKGFVMNDDRLAGDEADYFDELVERVRAIRTSERHFYRKVGSIFATSVDYDPGTGAAQRFFATVQNKFHFAVTGHTAAELITTRVDSSKRSLGLTSWKGQVITQQDATIAKNYLEEIELKQLELLVEQFLAYAELQSVERKPYYMADWIRKFDGFLRFNEKQILKTHGSVSRKAMEAKVRDELRQYRQRQKLTDKQLGPQSPVIDIEPDQNQ